MRTVVFLPFLFIAASMNVAYAQTSDDFRAEEFIAKVFYGNMTEDSPKVYLSRECYSGSTGYSVKDHSLELFNELKLSGILSEDEIQDFFTRYDNMNTLWNEHAPVFQQPKYKNLIFVDDIFRLSGRKQKRAELRCFSKPVFIKDGEYAYVTESTPWYYQCDGWNWKKPWKSFRCGIQMYLLVADYGNIYQQINGKWVKIISVEIGSAHA
jgi:hypothetical protein